MSDPIDLIIRNGVIYDGSGGEPYRADIAINGGMIVGIGSVDRPARDEIDAAGCIVTPGFVDIHTHYDGQVMWSEQLIPSSCNGVTTVVAGNCGVGFAPCRAGDRAMLVNAMEGVEDIPEVVMTEGLPWDWETFPQYMEAIDRRRHDIDVAVYLPHTPLRIYVMGDRAANSEPATEADIEEMARLAREAMQAGAMGIATSRTDNHRRKDGEHLASFEADEQELIALSRAVGGRGRGLFQIVPEQRSDGDHARRQFEMLERIARAGDIPVTFTLIQSNDYPDRWRDVLNWVYEANGQSGVMLRPQIFPRPVGFLLGHDLSMNPFTLCPSYALLRDMSLAEKLVELCKPEVRQRLISEMPIDPAQPIALFGRQFDKMFVLGDPPNYEPDPQDTIAARAQRMGVTPQELAYDLLLERDGKALLWVGFVGFANGSLDYVLDLAGHPDTVLGLGDGGAHLGMICDSSYTTFLLTYWARDRSGGRMPLAKVIKSMTSDTADLVGLSDRGQIALGRRADINVIDYEKLRLLSPEILYDLPAGGRRVIQRAEGYRWTLVNGQPIFHDGHATGALPGRLVRGAAHRKPEPAQ